MVEWKNGKNGKNGKKERRKGKEEIKSFWKNVQYSI